MKIIQAIKEALSEAPAQARGVASWAGQNAAAVLAAQAPARVFGTRGGDQATGAGDTDGSLHSWIAGAQTAAEAEVGDALYHLVRKGDPSYLALVDELEREYDSRVGAVKIGDARLAWHPTVSGAADVHGCTLTLTINLMPLDLQTSRRRWPGTAVVDVRAAGGYKTSGQMDADLRRARDMILGGHPMPIRFSEDEVMEDPKQCAVEIARIALASLPSPRHLEADGICLRGRPCELGWLGVPRRSPMADARS